MKWCYKLIILSFLLPAASMAQSNIEFEKAKKKADRRYKSFYSYIRKKRRQRAKIEEFAEISKARKLKRAAQLEKLRLRYVASRKAKPSREAGEKAHELKIKRRQERINKKRKVYARQQAELRRLKKGIGGIPENQDVGLELVK